MDLQGTSFSSTPTSCPVTTEAPPTKVRKVSLPGGTNELASLPTLPMSATDKGLAQRDIQAKPVPVPTDSQKQYRALETQALDVYFGKREWVDSPELLEYLIRNKVMNPRWIIKHSSPDLQVRVLSPELLIANNEPFCSYNHRGLTAEHYQTLIEKKVARFDDLPKSLRNTHFFLLCLKQNPKDIRSIRDTHLSLEDPSIIPLLKQCDASDLVGVLPESQISEDLLAKAIQKDHYFLNYAPDSLAQFTQLARAAIEADSNALKAIPKHRLTQELVELAANGSPAIDLRFIPRQFLTREVCESVIRKGQKLTLLENFQHTWIFTEHPDLADLAIDCCGWARIMPKALKSKQRLEQYLKYYPWDIYDIPKELLLNNRHWCERALQTSAYALCAIPDEIKDYSLYLDAVRRWPMVALEFISQKTLAQYPELAAIAARQGQLHGLPDAIKTEQLCAMAVNVNPKAIQNVPDNLKHKMPLWALACHQANQLPNRWQQHILDCQDTCYLPDLPSPGRPTSSHDLLKSMPPNRSHTDTDTVLIALKKQLLACQPFQLRHAMTGHGLQAYIDSQHTEVEQKLLSGHLPLLEKLPDAMEVYGGRTALSQTDPQAPCQRYKFLRKGEPLAEFAREQATHQFCHETPLGQQLSAQLQSEVPVAHGLYLIEPDKIPEPVLQSFKSELETLVINGKTYLLCYHFSTRDRQYSTQAHQSGSDGDPATAELGLLKAAHDLGVWSSCGAVHTSTIRAYHDSDTDVQRKELFLTPLFSSRYTFPGCLEDWNSWATDESDWGWSGLRDIGDMEFYPHIQAYTSNPNADFTPPGYAQRSSFLEGFASNMVAAALLYARLHQDDPDYHYQEEACVRKTAEFIEAAINQYLTGLLGKPSRAKRFFESPAIYQTWLQRTAREIVYWTAPQAPGTECISAHLSQQGHCDPAVYPDCDTYRHYYFMNKELDSRELGLGNAQFGFTWLVRGLGLVAGGIAEQLQPPSETPATDEQADAWCTIV